MWPPLKQTCFVGLPFAMKPIYINFPASKSLQRPRSSGLLVHTTGGGPSGQKIFHQRYITKVTHYNREIKPIDTSAKDMDELQADLCDFIVEIRKENGEQYPSSSMYDLISGLSLYLEREHGFTNKLVSGAFRAVRNTLDNVMKERTAEGVGGGLRGIQS